MLHGMTLDQMRMQETLLSRSRRLSEVTTIVSRQRARKTVRALCFVRVRKRGWFTNTLPARTGVQQFSYHIVELTESVVVGIIPTGPRWFAALPTQLLLVPLHTRAATLMGAFIMQSEDGNLKTDRARQDGFGKFGHVGVGIGGLRQFPTGGGFWEPFDSHVRQ